MTKTLKTTSVSKTKYFFLSLTFLQIDKVIICCKLYIVITKCAMLRTLIFWWKQYFLRISECELLGQSRISFHKGCTIILEDAAKYISYNYPIGGETGDVLYVKRSHVTKYVNWVDSGATFLSLMTFYVVQPFLVLF